MANNSAVTRNRGTGVTDLSCSATADVLHPEYKQEERSLIEIKNYREEYYVSPSATKLGTIFDNTVLVYSASQEKPLYLYHVLMATIAQRYFNISPLQHQFDSMQRRCVVSYIAGDKTEQELCLPETFLEIFQAQSAQRSGLFDSCFNLYAQIADSTASYADAEPKIIEQLHGDLIIENESELEDFLRENVFLIPVINLAANEMKKYFSNLKLTVDCFTDPEAIDVKSSVILVESDLPPLDALEILEKFENEWWIHHFDKAEGKLFFNLKH